MNNDNAGTFTADAGPFSTTPGDTRAKWNFSFYANAENFDFSTFQLQLLYDFDPGANTAVGGLGVFDFDVVTGTSSGTTVKFEDSQNLGFAYLNAPFTGIPPVPGSQGFPSNTPPSFGPFDPNANAEYSFSLRVINRSDSSVAAQSAILVNVGDGPAVAAVPEPGTLAGGLVGISLAGLGLWRRRRPRG